MSLVHRRRSGYTGWREEDHPRDPANGEFTDKSGGWAGAVSLQLASHSWERVDPDEYLREWRDEMRAVLADAGVTGGEADHQIERVRVASHPPVVYRNGPHSVLIDTRQPIPLKELLSHVDQMLHDNPPTRGPARIRIVSPGVVGFSGGTTTIPDPPVVYLTHDMFDGWPPGTDIARQMPVSREVEPWRYVLTHEWGHAISTRTVGAPVTADDRKWRAEYNDWSEEMSPYGEEGGAHEGEAEMFAEWYLTGGQTKSRPARFYAHELGWKA